MEISVYVQYTSPTRGKQRPILFDKARYAADVESLIQKAKSTIVKNTAVFIGQQCNRCKAIFPTDQLSVGHFCSGCCQDMDEQDKEEPDGGAYREHQWT